VTASPPQPVGLAPDFDRSKHARALARLIRGEVRFDAHDRMLYATDASLYQVEPLGVVVPADADDARAVVRYCIEHDLPILPRGGGTSLAGQCVSRAVVVDCSAHMHSLHRVDDSRGSCGVDPGMTIEDLNIALRDAGHDWFFAPDPSTVRQATIAGCIGNNAAGTRSIKYGRTAENLEAVTLHAGDGKTYELGRGAASSNDDVRALTDRVIDVVRRHESLIRERFPKTLRRNAGYALDMILAQVDEAERTGVHPYDTVNLAHLVCGGEGTLGLVTHATLKLHPTPRAKGLAVLGFNSLDAAIDSVMPLLELQPSAIELLDDMVIGLARKNIQQRPNVELMPQPTDGRLEAVLYVEFLDDMDSIHSSFDALRARTASLPGAVNASYLADPAEITGALELRKAGEPLLHALPGKRKPVGFVEDNAVPPERLSEFVRGFRDIVTARGTTAAFYAHASVGVLHVRPLLDLRDAEDRQRMQEIAVEVADLAKSLGGVMSGEHGDGRSRGPLVERFFGPELMEAFREIKHIFDPKGLFNPGDIVEPRAIDTIHESTRTRPVGADVHAPDVDTYFHYVNEGGFDHAVELCNGAGVCRKTQGGTMCPSYMAMRDERHSTRGRGNALRLAVTGQLPGGEPGSAQWGDPETLETLRLCLSCKACKTECPSNVDVAQYKAEYLAQTYKDRGSVPLQARAFANVRALNRLGSAFAPISNWVANFPLARMINDRLLGLSAKRSIPAFAPSLFRQARRTDINENLPETAPIVLLYADCFTTYNEPGIGLATMRVLNACGYRVEIVDVGCCARTHVSTGMLEEATDVAWRAARHLLFRAHEIDAADAKSLAGIVVCEPSCLSAIKDEWFKFKFDLRGLSLDKLQHHQPNPDNLEALAQRCFLPEDFVARHWDEHPTTPNVRTPPSGNIVLHGHCHQKALWGASTTAALLAKLAGAERVRVLDSGCCGMAGSFGYTADRYDLSMQIGELTLFPAVRELGPDDVLIAPGTSCRHQIRDGAPGAQPLHPMEWAATVLGSEE
jgi:FAD/FMN-containing dehydrogenase/Fe-S oxidoreductase